MYNIKRKLEDSIAVINKKIGSFKPEIGLVLGSGLGILAEEMIDPLKIPYQDVPHFPRPTVEGHAGQLIFGRLSNIPVLTCQGRLHYYEGYTATEITYPIRIMQLLGVKTLLVTNAAGGINISYSPGDLMLITDHINLMGENPLRGPNDAQYGPRFPDMSEAYALDLRERALKAAAQLNIKLQTGIYAGLCGPSYETPAEIKFLRTIGADAVGMSTVPEVIVANHAGIKVLGISCITNMAAGVLPHKLSHEEVVTTAEKVKNSFANLLKQILANLA